MSTSRTPAQWGAAALLLVAGGTHLPLIPEHLEEAPYVGVLFILLTAACVVLAVAILVVGRPAVWALSAVVCFAAVVAFLASRTVGLPELGDDVGNWTEPWGFPAVASEALVVALAAIHLRHRREEPS